ncbi:MAG TPA: assimilatory sulfite reductase (NADPH) flavoprotein subunit [Arenimonas sp.]|uniref:assimilatory sulfite reductase (NADPH) flavoprotein subunit n=1 Tax=Arenimonas sp. TaxID=1872635 RepID=UPI002D7F56E1|nr:assimilatory sulfite reductase (NADPH) flavoprotein subunit [Arenimonas sp.]HEU0151810.1 assimilatory sulfite reductase (NADPH) flavoprotein subunit [Arenimonas sp.]
MPPAPAALPVPPLPGDKVDLLARLTDGLDAPGLWWLSGYAAGLAARPGDRPAAPATTPGARLSVVYGSQTGQSRRLAERLAEQAGAAGLAVRLLRADAYPLHELKDERLLYVVISTQGEGEPPDDARGFVSHLLGKRAPKLPQLQFAVLGLGDSSYPLFNATAREVDERLAALGGRRLFARGEADVDIDTVATPWLDTALAQARARLATMAAAAAPAGATVTPLRALAPASPWSREQPFAAELLANQRLTGRGSRKDVRHLELSLEGSGLAYQPGDALGLWPRNPPALVDAVMAALALDPETPVDGAPLRTWLAERRELTRLARPFLHQHAERGGHAALARRLQPAQAADLATLLASHQLIDLLEAWPAAWTAQDLVAALRPLAPRLYSIASSQRVVGAEAHLTVDHLAWDAPGGRRWGAASHRLASATEGEALPVFIEPNERFRLPRDGQRDVVMIGPGTGVAPFRGFVQERAATGAAGRQWLLFGAPHARHDFLYQLEWQQALKAGQLHRLDLAFSRDQADKVYVQHRLREHGRDLFDWLEGGAHLYVCGASAMGRDVEAALLEIVGRHGGRDVDGAREYLASLQQQGRYARDVY